jgi:hypothetical protein
VIERCEVEKGGLTSVTASKMKLYPAGDGAGEVNLSKFLALFYFHFHVKSLFKCDLSSSSMISFSVRRLTLRMVTYRYTYIQLSNETAQLAGVFYENSKIAKRNGDAIK